MLKIAETKMTVWGPKVSEQQRNTVIAVGSTCRSDNRNGEKEFSYQNWSVYFKGDAYLSAKELKEKERILIKNAIIENRYDKEKDKLYCWCTIFSFELLEKKDENAS